MNASIDYMALHRARRREVRAILRAEKIARKERNDDLRAEKLVVRRGAAVEVFVDALEQIRRVVGDDPSFPRAVQARAAALCASFVADLGEIRDVAIVVGAHDGRVLVGDGRRWRVCVNRSAAERVLTHVAGKRLDLYDLEEACEVYVFDIAWPKLIRHAQHRRGVCELVWLADALLRRAEQHRQRPTVGWRRHAPAVYAAAI